MTKDHGLAGVAALLIASGCGDAASAPARVMEVKRQDLVIDVEMTGALKALDSESVHPPSGRFVGNFKITRLAPEGATLQAGTEVIAFDTSELEKRLRDYENEVATVSAELGRTQAEANLARLNDRLELEKAEANERKKGLKADKPADITAELTSRESALDRTLSQQEVAYRKTKDGTNRRREAAQLAGFKERLDRAQSRVKEVREAIVAMSVKARRAGTVVYKEGWRGEKKKVGDQVWGQENAFEIASLDRMAAQGQVDEVDASKVRKGQRVALRLESHPDVEYAGIVGRIDTMVRTESPESRVKVAKIELALEKTDAAIMRPGMRFRGRIELDRIPNVLQIPITALRSTVRGPMVERMAGRGAIATPVKLGRRSRDAVEILAGVTDGDRIAVDGAPTKSRPGGPRMGAP